MRAKFETVGVRGDIVFIVDRNCGAMSVTNDAEAVVEHVASHYPGKRIVYRDTDNRWDELLHRNGMFLGFAPFTGSLP